MCVFLWGVLNSGFLCGVMFGVKYLIVVYYFCHSDALYITWPHYVRVLCFSLLLIVT